MKPVDMDALARRKHWLDQTGGDPLRLAAALVDMERERERLREVATAATAYAAASRLCKTAANRMAPYHVMAEALYRLNQAESAIERAAALAPPAGEAMRETPEDRVSGLEAVIEEWNRHDRDFVAKHGEWHEPPPAQEGGAS